MKKDLRKVGSGLLVALFLLPGILFAFPAVSAFSGNSSLASSPATVSGATAAIDVPVLASIGGAGSDTRTITVTNPNGNPGITSVTISVPAGSLKASTTPTGTIPSTGGVPQCGAGCTASVYGTSSGPWSLIYQDTASPHGVILPGGASIQLQLTETPETATAVSGVADTFSLTVSVTDTTGAITNLNSITIYDTASTAITLGTLSATSVTAGSTFTFTATTADTGVPLVTSTTPTNTPATTTVSPSTFTTGASATKLTVNDTKVESVTVTVNTGKVITGTTGGTLTATTGSVSVVAGASSALSITINGYSNKHQINMTSAALLAGSSISISSTDKFGNPVTQASALKVTVVANTISGDAAGFTNESSYTTPTTYPYTPSGILALTTIFISAGQSTNTTLVTQDFHHNGAFYFGPDYGSKSSITASASGVTSTTSGTIVTWTFQSTAPTLSVQGGTSVQAGSSGTIDSLLPFPQAGVPVYFTITANSSGYAGLFSNGLRSVATTSTANTTSNGMAVGLASLKVDTTNTASATVTSTYAVSPTANATSASITLTTTTGKFASLSVKAYFDSGDTQKATAIKASGSLYLDVSAADAYGNPISVATGTTLQVNLATSAGSLSSATAFIVAGQSDIKGSGYQVQLVAPASGSFTVTASGTYSGTSASGSLSLSVVSAYPTVVFVSVPSSVTTGIAQQITGWANVSKGVAPTTITVLKYNLNSAASNVSIGAGSATNQFTLSLLLAKTNTLVVYAEDGNGLWSTATVQIPTVATDHTFANSTTPQSVQFPNGGPQAVNATFTNNGINSLTVIVVGEIFQNVSNVWIPLVPPVSSTITNLGAGATSSAYLILQGYAAGHYKVQITVYSLAYVTLSQTQTVYVTVT